MTTSYLPLSARMRPKSFDDVAGQDHLLGKNGAITQMLERKKPMSILLWGPPGCGKTTIARLFASSFDLDFHAFSAVTTKISEIRETIGELKKRPLFGRQILLFIDEIHRFNKAQQDLFLPFIENGTIILIGATTENPSFALNNALLSRLRVLQLEPIGNEGLSHIVERYEKLESPLPLDEAGKKTLIEFAAGDGRHLLNMIQHLETAPKEGILNSKELHEILQKRAVNFDRDGDFHYQMISALHKSVRGSDPDAALYWFSRMIVGGEDPAFLARRIIRMATEDIGLADTNALQVTLNAWKAYSHLGSPEGELALAEAVVYLALAPKSNAIYTAYKKSIALATQTAQFPPPKTIINAPTKMMKELGFGDGYRYDHDTKHAFSGQNYFPHEVEREVFYHPKSVGFERELEKRIAYFNALREKINNSSEE